MKKIILIFLLFTALSAKSQQGKLYAYNVGLYLSGAAIHSLVYKQPLIDNLVKGFIAGNISFSSKTIKYPMLSRVIHSSAPLLITGEHTIDLWFVNFRNGKPRINATTTFGIFRYAIMGGKFDFKNSIKTGAVVFKINSWPGVAGESIGNSIIYQPQYAVSLKVVRHEFLHTLQFSEYMMFNSIIYYPIRNKKIMKYVEFGSPINQLSYWAYPMIHEQEAEFFK